MLAARSAECMDLLDKALQSFELIKRIFSARGRGLRLVEELENAIKVYQPMELLVGTVSSARLFSCLLPMDTCIILISHHAPLTEVFPGAPFVAR